MPLGMPAVIVSGSIKLSLVGPAVVYPMTLDGDNGGGIVERCPHAGIIRSSQEAIGSTEANTNSSLFSRALH
jgi:hypothetical protein